MYRWEFDKGQESLTVAVNGPLVVDDVELMTRAAIDGMGLAFMTERHASPYVARGVLVRVVEDWCPPFPGYFLYYPSRRQQPAALAGLIEALHLWAGRRRINGASPNTNEQDWLPSVDVRTSFQVSFSRASRQRNSQSQPGP